MKILAVIDSFKGSLTSMQAGRAAAEGILRAIPSAEVKVMPLADGGEGTVTALAEGLGGSYREVEAADPLGRRIGVKYCILPDNTAVIEAAAASGLPLLAETERSPMHTTTFGTGELIRDAVLSGCRRFIIGIGGSATNDGGIGCLQALGYSFKDSRGNEVGYGAYGAGQAVSVSTENVLPELRECIFSTACDVSNVLCGENGCSAVFSLQKGAKPSEVPIMDGFLRHYAELIRSELVPEADLDAEGVGAAGGLGFALKYVLGSSLESGAEMVMRETGIEEQIRSADVVVTGEGRLDAQTAMGKAPIRIAQAAQRFGKPVIAFCGCVGEGAERCLTSGITAYFPIVSSPTPLAEAMLPENAQHNLSSTVAHVFTDLRFIQ